MKKMNLGIRFILGFLSVILCVLLVVFTLTTAILADLNIVFQEDNLQKLLTETLFTSATAHRPAPHAMLGSNGSGKPSVQRFPVHLDEVSPNPDDSSATNSAMVEWIYDSVFGQAGDVEGIPTLEEVQSFVEESTFSDFLTGKTASIISDIITGENNTTITTEEIQTLLEENAQQIENTFGVELNDEAISQVVAAVEENEIVKTIQEKGVSAVVEELVSSGTIDLPMTDLGVSGDANGSSSALDMLNSIQSVVSTSTLLSSIGVCLVLIALLMVTNIKRIWIGINNTGISLTIAGFFLMIPTCLMWFGGEMLAAALKDAGPAYAIVLYVLKSTVTVHIGIFAGGIALIVAGCVLRSILKKRAKAALAAEASIEEAPVEEVAAEESSAEEAVAEEEASAEEAVAEEKAPAEEAAPEKAVAKEEV